MRACPSLLLCACALALLCAQLASGHPSLLCPPCEGEGCDMEPADCRYGLVHDRCGRQVCGKGPGEPCGGPLGTWGACGEGMHCKCDRCHGCSLHTLECNRKEADAFCM